MSIRLIWVRVVQAKFLEDVGYLLYFLGAKEL